MPGTMAPPRYSPLARPRRRWWRCRSRRRSSGRRRGRRRRRRWRCGRRRPPSGSRRGSACRSGRRARGRRVGSRSSASVISRSAAVTRGTPRRRRRCRSTSSSNEKPWKPRNCWTSRRVLVGRALGVGGDAPVVERARVVASNRPMTVWVLPTSMASSTQRSVSTVGRGPTADVEAMSSAAEWVRAPTEMKSAPAAA